MSRPDIEPANRSSSEDLERGTTVKGGEWGLFVRPDVQQEDNFGEYTKRGTKGEFESKD